jgi:glycosidase
MAYRVKKLWENYPRSAFRQLMNILGTHDTARILTALSEGSLGEKETRDRHGIALLVWALMPGIPCIYYGDELGYVGGKEPHNRGCYDWDTQAF